MSGWITDLADIASLFKSNGGASASSSTSNNTTVTVNPTILNAIDFSALEAPTQALVNSLSGVAPAIASVGDAITQAAKEQAAGNDQLKQLTIYISLAGLAFALIKLVK